MLGSLSWRMRLGEVEGGGKVSWTTVRLTAYLLDDAGKHRSCVKLSASSGWWKFFTLLCIDEDRFNAVQIRRQVDRERG